MTTLRPAQTDLDPRFSDARAAPLPWERAEELLAAAQLFWLSSVRPDGRPHVTTLIAVWHEGAIWFTTGPTERKARNIAANPNVVMTTGCNTYSGTDIVVEGTAVRQTDATLLAAVAEAYVAKYGEDWRFTPRDGAFYHGESGEHGPAYVFAIAPTVAFAFTSDDPPGQTRWRFRHDVEGASHG